MGRRASAVRIDVDEMARESKDKKTTQVTFRVPVEWLARADRVADKLSTAAKRFSRTDAMREALAAGFEALDAGETKPAKKAKR
jgi:hypothetical protein